MSVTALVVRPVGLVSTFIFNCLIAVTLGFFLLPINLIWVWLFMQPLIGLSWLWEKAPLFRLPAAILGIPAAVTGDAYAEMVPSMSERSRVTRLLICRTWPFSREFTAFAYGSAAPASDLEEVLSRLASRDPAAREFLAKLVNTRFPYKVPWWKVVVRTTAVLRICYQKRATDNGGKSCLVPGHDDHL